jgi:hypothetical protein
MRWTNKDKPNTLGALSWLIANEYVNYLLSSTQDAGWYGTGNTASICEALERGTVQEFGGGDSGGLIIRQMRNLRVKDKGLSWLFADLSKMQKLCLLTAVLVDGHKTSRGAPLSNARIAATLPTYAAQLRLGPAHSTMTDKTFGGHVSEGKKRFINRVVLELKTLAEKEERDETEREEAAQGTCHEDEKGDDGVNSGKLSKADAELLVS